MRNGPLLGRYYYNTPHSFSFYRFHSLYNMNSLNINSRITLNNGHSIPILGLGVYQTMPGQASQQAVLWALENGYRHIDTAALYGNEADVGAAIRKSGIPRDEIFVTTKLWNSDHGFEKAIEACETSLKKLGLDYIDLYIIHSPLPGAEKRKKSWDALQKMVADGKVKNIGVSNYGVNHIKELLGSNPSIRPVVNQIEISPWLTRSEIVTFCTQHNIAVEAYSPLTKGLKLSDPTLNKIAQKYDKTPAQVLIRWSLQRGFIVLPKSERLERIQENADVFDFDLSEKDMETLSGLDEYFTTDWDPTNEP